MFVCMCCLFCVWFAFVCVCVCLFVLVRGCLNRFVLYFDCSGLLLVVWVSLCLLAFACSLVLACLCLS